MAVLNLGLAEVVLVGADVGANRRGGLTVNHTTPTLHDLIVRLDRCERDLLLAVEDEKNASLERKRMALARGVASNDVVAAMRSAGCEEGINYKVAVGTRTLIVRRFHGNGSPGVVIEEPSVLPGTEGSP